MTELTDLKENVFDLVNMKNQTPLHLAAASPSAGKLCLLLYAGLWSYYLSCKILKCFLTLYLICTTIKKIFSSWTFKIIERVCHFKLIFATLVMPLLLVVYLNSSKITAIGLTKLLWQLCAAMMSWVRRWFELVVY